MVTTPPITEFILIPGAGHCGQGVYDRGHIAGIFAEVDLVDRYVASIADELDNSAIRHRILPTRKAPGIAEDQRYTGLFSYQLPIMCRIGFSQAKKIKPVHNQTVVYHGPEIAAKFATDLAGVIGHWGSIYAAHGHKTSNPVLKEDLKGFILEPFFINGPNASEYSRWLDKLGRDVGRFLADWVRARGDASVMSVNRGPLPKGRVSV